MKKINIIYYVYFNAVILLFFVLFLVLFMNRK